MPILATGSFVGRGCGEKERTGDGRETLIGEVNNMHCGSKQHGLVVCHFLKDTHMSKRRGQGRGRLLWLQLASSGSPFNATEEEDEGMGEEEEEVKL